MKPIVIAAMLLLILATHPSVEFDGFFRAREDNLLLGPHVAAEVVTAGGLTPMYIGLTGAGLSIGVLW